MPLDPKRLARDALKAQSTRPDSLVGRETTGVTRAVRAALPAIRRLRSAHVTWAAIAEAITQQGIRQSNGEPLTASRLTSIVSQVERQERRKAEQHVARQTRGDLAVRALPATSRRSPAFAAPIVPVPSSSSPRLEGSEEALRRQGLAELQALLKG